MNSLKNQVAKQLPKWSCSNISKFELPPNRTFDEYLKNIKYTNNYMYPLNIVYNKWNELLWKRTSGMDVSWIEKQTISVKDNDNKINEVTKFYFREGKVRGDGYILENVYKKEIDGSECKYFAHEIDGHVKGIDAHGSWFYP